MILYLIAVKIEYRYWSIFINEQENNGAYNTLYHSVFGNLSIVLKKSEIYTN